MLPIGIIVLWFGSEATVPGGWHICDGNAGTPDLRDRFLVGAGSTFNPGDAAGSLVHNHDYTGDGHFHGTQAGVGLQPGTGKDDDTDVVPGVGTTDNQLSLPPYHSLYYIMRV